MSVADGSKSLLDVDHVRRKFSHVVEKRYGFVPVKKLVSDANCINWDDVKVFRSFFVFFEGVGKKFVTPPIRGYYKDFVLRKFFSKGDPFFLVYRDYVSMSDY